MNDTEITYDLDRDEDEPCERGTIGCPVSHRHDEACETY